MGVISDKEYKMFSEQLAQRFERKVKGHTISINISSMPKTVTLVPLLNANQLSKIAQKKMVLLDLV